jgi:hypothetical protein
MPPPDQTLIVTGKLRSGAFHLRGLPIAKSFNLPVKKAREITVSGAKLDTLLLVKTTLGFDDQLRRHCRRLIYDPIDCWRPLKAGLHKADPNVCVHFWRRQYASLRFDDILATSPAMHQILADSVPANVRIWYVPHHADPRLDAGYNAQGPVVYVGDARYLSSFAPQIIRACRALGREFKISNDLGDLCGASLALALRLPPTDTDLNRWCKPQVKLENAAAVSLPVLASNHPAIVSLRPECYVVPDVVEDWAPHIRAALSSTRLQNPVREAHYIEQMRRVLSHD